MIGQAVLLVLIGYKLFKYNNNDFEIYNKTETGFQNFTVEPNLTPSPSYHYGDLHNCIPVTDHPSTTQCLTKQGRIGDLHKCKTFHQLKLKDLQKLDEK